MVQSKGFAVHDLSRIEINENSFPRFNMPFELGLFWGARKFGDKQQQSKNAVIFEREKFQYQQYISDINGIDTKAHNNKVPIIMEKTRDWLRTASGRSTGNCNQIWSILSPVPHIVEYHRQQDRLNN